MSRSSRQLRVERGVFDRFPGVRIVVVSAAITSRSAGSAVETTWRDAWTQASAMIKPLATPQSHPRIEAWRSAFRTIGISGKEFPSSIEALARRACKDAEPFRINQLVDFYNSVSLRHLVPAGGFDLATVTGDIELRLTREGDTFWGLDASEPVLVPAGEVAYADSDQVLTRHFVWRQSRRGLVTEKSNLVLLVAEVLGPLGEELAESVATDLRDGLRTWFGASPSAAIATSEAPVVPLAA